MRVPWGHRSWNRVLVYGLGASGLAAARLLRSRGVEVLGVDRRESSELDLADLASDPGVELVLGSEPIQLPEGVDGVVMSPGVPLDRPLVQAAQEFGLPVIAEVELAFQLAPGPVVAITGSNGKSTTTQMTGEILAGSGYEVEICGNIGVPLAAVVEGAADRIFVTELSSFQLESVDTFRPRAAALLNLSTDHLDRHRDQQSYAAAKMRIFENQEAGDVAVLNADDARIADIEVSARKRQFSRLRPVEDGCFLEGEHVIEVAPGGEPRPLFTRGDLSVPGVHNLENAMAAALLSRAVGARPEAIPVALNRFQGLPHRLQRVAERRGVLWFDDSKATNSAAALKSLAGFADGSVHLILGGRNKGADPSELTAGVARKVRRLYLIGEAAEEFAGALAGVAPCDLCGSLEAAVTAAAEQARPGEAVLLSPACASFDQYRSFAHRGDHFQTLVRSLDG